MTWWWLRWHRRHGQMLITRDTRTIRGTHAVVFEPCEVYVCGRGHRRWRRDLRTVRPPISGAPRGY